MTRRIITTQLEANTSSNIDGYFDKLIKYIPSEIVVGWIAVKGLLISDNEIPSNSLLWILFIVFTGLTAVYIFKQTSEPRKPPAITQVLISTGAFIVWVFALGERFSSLAFYRPVYGSVVLILYSLIVPLFNPPEGEKVK
ncbi:hypothetical protein DP113_26420 [Brasilonema octagenarum UFV-E1]|uniref:Uncharacterized protein n=1 Tax=Brasilonema sennae CENA114 TaxID=415709 RepID=A0A856MHZ8_9CYAN|nr:hypothetical protein [Brasilonema sennae]QDL10985.1 hypothetical protein DP114_26495 [Brasilonema sennae CENA114]QDL17331.1 hypothetical protein DP113_26420 [Brasilonema octagenarum UFV-E1]